MTTPNRSSFGPSSLPFGINKEIVKPQREYWPLANGGPTNVLGKVKPEDAKCKELSMRPSVTLDREGVTVIFNEIAKTTDYRVGTNKLFDYSTALLTRQLTKGVDLQNLEVEFSLEDYASLQGIKVRAELTPDMTEAEIDKERKRAKEAMKGVRQDVARGLDALYNISLSWSEKQKGKEINFYDQRIITGKGIRNSRARISFDPKMANYLAMAYVAQYPVSLLTISDRYPSAYSMGRKFAVHASMYANVVNERDTILSVETLLEAGGRDASRVTNRRHRQQIVDPFERDLDMLVACGVLSSWEYCQAKGEPLTDEQAENHKTFSVFKNLYVKFDLVNNPMKTPEQLERIAEHKKATEKRKAKGQKAKKEV